MGRIKNKKAGMEISIVLLVIATLILTSFALYTFYTKQKSTQEKIYITRFLEDIYSKEEIINFYINEILEKAVKGTEGDKSKIIENFTKELERYKINGNYVIPELNQLEGQINEEHINYDKENNIVTAEFTINLEDKVIIKEKKAEKEIFSAIYTHKKKFEKQL